MKKIINYFLILMIVCFPFSVFADSGANGAGNKATTIKDTGSGCGSTNVCRANYWGGVRITYVYADGTPASDSYDFISNAQAVSSNFQYNSLSGDKSKLSGSSSFSSTSASNIPSMQNLVNSFKSSCGSLGEMDGTQLSCKAQGYTSHTNLSFSQEQQWFNSLTKKGLTSAEYMGNIEALNKAIQAAYPSFNADSMQQDMIDACSNGQDIYIQMEPLFTTWNGGGSGANKFVLGTFRDQYQYYQNLGKEQKFVNKYNCDAWNFSSLMYYDSNSETQSFEGFSTATSKTKWTDPNEKNGTGAIINWANNMKDFCKGCTFTDGEFKIDDKPIEASSYAGSNLYEYVLSSDGDTNCCGQVNDAINNGDPNVTDELKEYYDFYCDLKGDPCTEKEFESLGRTIYFCPNGQQCSHSQYEEQCDPPPKCEEDPDDPNNPKNECCTENPIEPGKIEGDVHNCCEDNTESEAHEYKLNELFCDNNYLGVSNYQAKCGTEFYYEEGTALESDYCNMYCTERVSVEIPGSIAAISGRYFKLNKTNKGGTASSYIEGYKRCRIRIQYDTWEKDYYDTVEEQVDAYNSFQENKAYQKLYEQAEADVIPNQTETSDIKCSCSCSYSCSDGKGGTTTCSYEPTKESSCEIKFNKYPFKKMLDIYPVQTDEDKRDACEDIYEAIEFIEDDDYKTEHDPWSAWEIDPSIQACNQKTNSMVETKSNGKCSCTLSCGRTETEAEKNREDVHTERQNYNAMADADNASFNAAADIAKQLEETIDVCDKYFTDYDGADAEANYPFDATQQFYYTQIYMDELGGLKLDEIYVDFEETPGCVIDPNVSTSADAEDGMQENQYSTKYGNGDESMTDFANNTLDYQDSADGYKQYEDETYDADKIFTTDARYHVECKWNEGQNTLYTLVPNGAASEAIETSNYTEHNQEYKVYLTTLEGKYETYWDIDGLGTPRKGESEGRFDKFFRDAGNTCSNSSTSEYVTLSCTISSQHEIVLTGYCNGSNGTDTTVNPDDCDPYEEGYRLFNFKVVDAANLFPSGVIQGGNEIAKNWTSTEEGQAAMLRIQSDASSGKTYSPDNLTYSFALTPNDMAQIKDYNALQVDNGGYSDFNLYCRCDEVIASVRVAACYKCKSPFLENLSSGIVNTNGVSHSVSGWSNPNKDLTAVRAGYGMN